MHWYLISTSTRLFWDHFRSRFSTSSAPLLLADSEELILWDRNLVVSPTGWKHHTRSKRISNFNIPTYQLVQRDKSSLHQVEHEWLHCIFFHSNSWNLVCQSWQFKAYQREWYGKLPSLWLAEPGCTATIWASVDIVSDICTFEKVVKMWSSIGFDLIRYKFYKHKPPQLPNVPAKSGCPWKAQKLPGERLLRSRWNVRVWKDAAEEKSADFTWLGGNGFFDVFRSKNSKRNGCDLGCFPTKSGQ